MAKILVADDDSSVRQMVAKTLSEDGSDLLEAVSGSQALEIARREHPDVIVLDVWMPGMDGFEVLQKLKENPVTQSTPVVMLTGFPLIEGEATALGLSAAYYVTKPWNSETLKSTVRVALREGMAVTEEEIDTEESDTSESEPQVIRMGGRLGQLEQIMDGGVPLGTVTLIEGASSAGKSVLCQHFAYGALVDGHGTAYFTSEHTPRSLVAQMESIGLEVSEYLPDQLQIYSLPERSEDETPELLLATVVRHLRQLTQECEFIILDAITELAAPSEDRAVIDFFISCKNICTRDKTIAIALDSYAFGAEMFSRLGALIVRLSTPKVSSGSPGDSAAGPGPGSNLERTALGKCIQRYCVLTVPLAGVREGFVCRPPTRHEPRRRLPAGRRFCEPPGSPFSR